MIIPLIGIIFLSSCIVVATIESSRIRADSSTSLVCASKPHPSVSACLRAHFFTILPDTFFKKGTADDVDNTKIYATLGYARTRVVQYSS